MSWSTSDNEAKSNALEYETILTRRAGAALIITMNRPQRRNAVNLRMMDEVAAAARQAEEDPAVRAVIITEGEKNSSRPAPILMRLWRSSRQPPESITWADGIGSTRLWRDLANQLLRRSKGFV